MAAKRDGIFEFVNGWRKKHPGEPLKVFLEGNSHVPAEFRSARLRNIRSWLAEFESKKTVLETEFPHLMRGFYSPYSERQEDWEYNLGNIVIPQLRLEISRRARTDTPPKESITYNDSISPARTEFRHSADYRSVTHRGKRHSLTPRQAQMIQILHEADQNGTPEISIHAILEQLGTSGSRWQGTFRSNPEAKKALIKSGARKGTLRLNL
jgi:hypothetical protein